MNLDEFIEKTKYISKKNIKEYSATKEDIFDLFKVAQRDITDSKQSTINLDAKFGHAYNAALKLCTIILRSQNLRVVSGAHHYITIKTLPFIMGSKTEADSDYLDNCREKRNELEYERANVVGPEEAEDLIEFCEKFYIEVEQWMYANHPNLMGHDE